VVWLRISILLSLYGKHATSKTQIGSQAKPVPVAAARCLDCVTRDSGSLAWLGAVHGASTQLLDTRELVSVSLPSRGQIVELAGPLQ
jgi:hypothetical protein